MIAFAAVDQVLKRYFDGLHHCDTDLLAEVFHPKAVYATADEESFLYRDMTEYLSVVAARESPASRQESRLDFVDGIEFAGENTAFARVRCSMGERDFVDFLTLVRTNGRWRIMSKVFHISHNNRGGN